MTIHQYIYVWPDGSYAENERDLQEMLKWKSDDYRKILIDETFDQELHLFGESDDASTRSS